MPKINESVGCNVTECKYHAKTQQYCSLDQIQISHHNEPAKTIECTDCHSFEPTNK